MSVVAGLFFCPSAKADTLTMVADEWCPYNCKPNTQYPGFLVEVAQCALQPFGHRINYRIQPWQRAIASVHQNNAEGLLGVGQYEARPILLPKTPLLHAIHQTYTTTDSNWRYQRPESLANMRLGIIAGYSYGNFLADVVDNERVRTLSVTRVYGQQPLLQLLNLLAADRIDVFVEEQRVLNYQMQQWRGHEISLRAAGTVDREPIYIGFSPTNPNAKRYIQQLEKGIQRLKADGTYTSLQSKYGMLKGVSTIHADAPLLCQADGRSTANTVL
ncbi:substrate-binding periplasmic protein [Idiomarina tyrosinivorans]|nr:transporter substrate-binding domain-containing protein [Idiomarina tyrosinivorans]